MTQGSPMAVATTTVILRSGGNRPPLAQDDERTGREKG